MVKLNNKTKGIFERICKYLGFLNSLIPKNKKKILIYNSSPSYQNNYAIFNYLIENGYNKKYKIYYYMPEVEKYVDKNLKNVKLKYSLGGATFHYLTSKYVFLDTGNMRMKPSKKQVVMNLWHGVPFKAIGWMSKKAKRSIPKKNIPTYSKIIVSGKNMKDVYIRSFLLSKDQIFYSGQPRNDLLKSNVEPFKELGINASHYKKIVMWMTTYRITEDGRINHTSNPDWSQTNLPLITNKEKIVKLNEQLESNNVLLLIKHHTTGESSDTEIEEMNNIKILDEDDFLSKGIQLYEVLGKCDALVTDYSSVFIDYLLVDKPIGFIIDDIEDYKKSNGFSKSKPLEFMPGHHINNLDDLNNFFTNVVEEDDNYKIKRKKVSNYFNEHHKESNSKHVLMNMNISKQDKKKS